ncbi:OmpA family protein [Vibrio sp. PNB22_3_1]
MAGTGAWKIALADLMISMMCIFLTLWILQFLDKSEQVHLIELLSSDSDAQPELSIMPDNNSVSPLAMTHIATSRFDSDLRRVDHTSLLEGTVNSQQDLQVLAEVIEERIESVDQDGALDVLITPQGLKMVISDTGQGPMFTAGSTNIRPYYQDLLLALSPVFSNLGNKVVIAGHTDASRYIGSDRTNWDLSAGRANKARHYLQRGGLSRSSIFQVTGFADSALLDVSEPRSAKNRRIEIVVLTKDAEARLKRVYHNVDVSGAEIESETLEEIKQDASGVARSNLPVDSFEALQAQEAVDNEAI